MPKIELCLSTDRSYTFTNIANFVDQVRKNSNVSDDKIVMKHSFDESDHETAVHIVDTEADWNQEALEVDNETIVVFRKEALTPDDSKSAWTIAYNNKEIRLSLRSSINSSRVLPDGQVMIKGVGNFPKSYFRVVRKI
jgi:hypothetical protein